MINPRAIIFLFILLSVVLFLAGFRLGKKIEHIDKTTLPLLTPTTTPQPTITPLPLKFNTFLSTDCGLKFLYLDSFKEEEASTDEARLVYDDEKITIDCRKSKIEEFTKNKKSYQKEDEITIKNQRIQVYKPNKRLSLNKDSLYIMLTSPLNAKKILITLPKNLLNLFVETIEFL